MPSPIPTPPDQWQRRPGNRFAGKIWLIVIFVILTALNYAASLVSPFIGSYGPGYCGALFVATFWNGVLLSAIWCRHGWARFALAAFLLAFVAGQLLFFPDVLVRYPVMKEDGIRVVVLLSAAYILAAAFILSSIDIRWITRPADPGDN